MTSEKTKTNEHCSQLLLQPTNCYDDFKITRARTWNTEIESLFGEKLHLYYPGHKGKSITGTGRLKS